MVRKPSAPRDFLAGIFYSSLELLNRSYWEHLDPATFHVPALDRTVHRDTEINRDPSDQIQHVTFHYLCSMAASIAREVILISDMDVPAELTLLLEQNGLRIENMWGIMMNRQ